MMETWYSKTFSAFLDVWKSVLTSALVALSKLIVALFLFLLSWLFAGLVGRLVTEVLKRVRLDKFFERTGWSRAFEKAGLGVLPSEFLGGVAKWFLIFLALFVIASVLGLNGLAAFLREDVIAFLSNLIVALLIFLVAVVAADALGKITVASVEKAKIGCSRLAGLGAKGAIWYFAISAILLQLEIFPEQLVTSLFRGILALIVISFGLAFGLGGKEIAAEILKDLKEKLRR